MSSGMAGATLAFPHPDGVKLAPYLRRCRTWRPNLYGPLSLVRDLPGKLV